MHRAQHFIVSGFGDVDGRIVVIGVDADTDHFAPCDRLPLARGRNAVCLGAQAWLETGLPKLACEKFGEDPHLGQKQAVGRVDRVDAAPGELVLRQDPQELAVGKERVGNEGRQDADANAGLDHLAKHQAVFDDEACRHIDTRSTVWAFQHPVAGLVGEALGQAMVVLEIADLCRRAVCREVGGCCADEGVA